MSSHQIDAVNMASPLTSLLTRYAFCVSVLFILGIAYRKWMNGREFDKEVDVAGRVAIVTGSNTGIGKETAMGLARYGVHVILACRNVSLANLARAHIIRETGNKNIRCMKLDLSSFKSIRKFADDFLATGLPLHILINNAGVMGMKRRLTEDGLEEHIGVNHFGHFLLTMLLLRRMIESKPSRVINVSSYGHRMVTIRKDDLFGEQDYNRFFAYCQSKLANVHFTNALAKRLTNTGVTSNSLHPGVIFTDLSRNLGSFSWILQKYVFFCFTTNGFVKFKGKCVSCECRWICDLFSMMFLRTTKSGAQTSIFAALDFNVQNVSGAHFS